MSKTQLDATSNHQAILSRYIESNKYVIRKYVKTFKRWTDTSWRTSTAEV